MWYRRVIGGDRSPIVDTWWQTETGAIMISPLPGVTATKPGSATRALPGIGAEVVDNDGQAGAERRRRVARAHRAVAVDAARHLGRRRAYKETYWSRFAEQGYYFAGDGAKKDDDGDLWLLGRVDDVMNVSGHRISTTEVESALVSHPSVAEAAVVGANDPTTGQGIVAFVILRGEVAADESAEGGEALVQELRDHVATGDRRDRQAAADHDRARVAEDPLGQDHAAAPARCRREPPTRRRHHARRFVGDGPDPGQVARRPVRGLIGLDRAPISSRMHRADRNCNDRREHVRLNSKEPAR